MTLWSENRFTVSLYPKHEKEIKNTSKFFAFSFLGMYEEGLPGHFGERNSDSLAD